MKQFRSLTAAFSRLNTIHKDIFPSQTSISTIISIISTALLFGAYSSTWKSRTSQEDYTHIPFSYDYKTLPRYNLNLPRLIFTNDKMTFFGKHTIVHKVVGSIKKEVSFAQHSTLQTCHLTRTTAFSLRETPNQ